jgi:hypothetical protein
MAIAQFQEDHRQIQEFSMKALFTLGAVSLIIPAWEMALYVCLMSIYVIWGKIKYCLLTTYLFALYWGYYLFAHDLLAAARGDPAAQSAYIVFGLLLLAFVLMALFYEER